MSFDSKEVKRAKAETMFIELVDQRDSGWVMDGTERTANEVRLKTPSAEFIPSRGFRLVKDEQTNEWYNEEIRFIKNQRELSLDKQKQRGITPSKNKLEDKIIVKGGRFSVTREGAYVSLFDYLKDVFYNGSNPNRPSSAKEIFRQVDFGAKEEAINEKKMAIAAATNFIGDLYTKRGKEFVYDEDKINALCQIFLVYAESPSGKINGLIGHAERDPEGFLEKATKLGDTLQMEIGHALELSVIKFDGNKAMYANKDKMIALLGSGNMSHKKKVEKLADLLATDEYKSAASEFMVELEAAKEKALRK